jgi:tetratricopeptide (TPR) repeat protein
MSGGPVLNEKGELIGIHGRAESIQRPQNAQLQENVYVLKTEFNYAIPINTFLSLAPQVDKTLALRIPSPLVPSTPKVDDFFLKADEQLKKANYEGAIASLNQAIRLNPKDARAHAARGSARDALGDIQGAMEDAERAIRLDPTYAIAYNNRGWARHELGDNQGAIADLDQAIRLDPAYAEAYGNRGLIRDNSGDKKGAIADYNQAILIDPENAPVYNNRGFVRDELGDKKGAIADLLKAADLFQTQGNEKNRQNSLEKLQQIKGRKSS